MASMAQAPSMAAQVQPRSKVRNMFFMGGTGRKAENMNKNARWRFANGR
jgi:hypothetical protein